ncbi:MAG: N-acetyltransferase [Haliscomenobacteraceae bacterium CHB4]|nr:hypothetical protein [Saprospiraceae bacterium]MCE7925159.1 N-acetyltransferase [Haliscomenobacteraceae bacterium CHB4]
MKIILETLRLILREVEESDLEGFFEMDSDPEVARYVGAPPVQHRQESLEIIRFVRSHYILYGMGRWAVVLKETGEFLGWCGVRPMREMKVNGRTDFVDISFRFTRRYWGKGYATEAAKAALDYGFQVLGYTEICSFADIRNVASQRVLEKIGLKRKNEFELEGDTLVWFEKSLLL